MGLILALDIGHTVEDRIWDTVDIGTYWMVDGRTLDIILLGWMDTEHTVGYFRHWTFSVL